MLKFARPTQSLNAVGDPRLSLSDTNRTIVCAVSVQVVSDAG